LVYYAFTLRPQQHHTKGNNMITRERMIFGTGHRNNLIAHLFGWCELSEHNDITIEDLVLYCNDMMLNNDSSSIRYNDIVRVHCTTYERKEYMFLSGKYSFSIVEKNHPYLIHEKTYIIL